MTDSLSGREKLGYSLFLVLLGMGWSFTIPMTKIAVSEGYKHFGLIFWQVAIGTVLMFVINAVRRKSLPMGRAQIRVYVIIALIGTVLPNTASFQAAVHLPGGLLSILLSMIPIFAFPIALALGNDRFDVRRFAGLLTGLCAVMLIVLPGAGSLGIPSIVWVFVGLIAGMFYAFEGNFVAKWGTAGLDPIQVLFGASLVGCVITLPIALLSGQWINPLPPYGVPDAAHVAGSVVHVLVYTGYVWLVGKTGAVFAVQVSYLVTLCGVFWSKILLDEAYAPQIWMALALMIGAMYLVQPRPRTPLAQADTIKDTHA
ncbi:DMT family transporter [Ascidiaceihabitans sp.]|uniref:DMT family transporter n=1 Tax=Ascidiaceihabitans sp. TaxID=1872644 RepID=UPI003298DF38